MMLQNFTTNIKKFVIKEITYITFHFNVYANLQTCFVWDKLFPKPYTINMCNL